MVHPGLLQRIPSTTFLLWIAQNKINREKTNKQTKRNDQARRLRRFWEYEKSILKVLDGIFWLLSGHSHLQSTKQTSLHLPSTSNGVFNVFDPRKTKALSENHFLILVLQTLDKPFSHKLKTLIGKMTRFACISAATASNSRTVIFPCACVILRLRS